ncbi:hypothetical protein F5Y08DRAFT_322323 [Xylaria arbuscula]|uniref:Uncharacterized protein n=1 Tax=Xylaria arbuscula TaxID=114810 RepID=A0A9W8TRK2_9PEZI|nr:hypothetical protein F5Y08DRAFT_322323 [Xylaria arbuscula]KAJ3578741.1 hypothetical protein NPX13_g1824 [Xylaria arbuscula]
MLAWKFLPFISSLGAASIAKRSIETDITIYVYGVGINGLAVSADSDSNAVMADNITASTYGLRNVTWTIDSTGSLPWNVTITNSSVDATGQFYILPSKNEGVGFATSPPTDAATAGFVVYGRTVQYATETTYESMFYAKNSSTGIWSLMWCSDLDDSDDGVPVVLKTIAPTPPTLT